MNRLLSQIRVTVALLLVGLGLAFGLSIAVAGDPSCAQPAGVHQASEREPAFPGVVVCEGRGCLPDGPGCCTGMTGGSCGLAALVAPNTPLPIVEINGAEWLAERTNSFLGLGPQARRRPPRLDA